MAAGHPNNPQHEQMSDESMLRNLAAQAEAIWPQERALVAAYELEAPAILDLGCGPGEISERLLAMFPGSRLVGVDLDGAHLVRAADRCARFGERARFVEADAAAAELGEILSGELFDLVICRHLLQAVPDPRAVLENMRRAARPGGRLHAVAEDYSMLHFWPVTADIDQFWLRGPIAFAGALGTDLRSGRKIYTLMVDLDVTDVRVDYVTVDTTRVPREIFERIWIAWRDGFAEPIARHSELDLDQVLGCFDEMIECIRSPRGYGVWQLPVISGVR